jgi:hypothetical protein
MPAGRPRFTSAYHSLIISMMVNCLLPGRIGELVRPVVLKKLEDVPLAASLATLGVERLLDLATLLMFLLPTLTLMAPNADTVVAFGNHQLNRQLLIDLGHFSLIASFFLLFMVYALGSDRIRSSLLAVLCRLPFFINCIGLKKLSRAMEKVLFPLQGIVERAAKGVKAICHWKGFSIAMIASLVFWAFNALSFYFLSIASPDIDLSYTDICGVMVIICFFIALPSVPGFWGLWEAAGVFALTFLGVAEEAAAGYSLFSHAFSIIPVIVAGWLSCMTLGFHWRTLTPKASSDLG